MDNRNERKCLPLNKKNKRKRNRSSVCNKCIISQFYSDRNSLIIVNGSVMHHLYQNRTETMAGQTAIRRISSFLRQVGRNPFHERCDSGVDTRIRILGTADSPADDTHLRPFTVSRLLMNQRTAAVALYTDYIQINCKYSLHAYNEACLPDTSLCLDKRHKSWCLWYHLVHCFHIVSCTRCYPAPSPSPVANWSVDLHLHSMTNFKLGEQIVEGIVYLLWECPSQWRPFPCLWTV